MNSFESLQRSILGPGSTEDVFLAPHSDDVCFSLGHLAQTRGAGRLITVFPVSQYCADPTLCTPQQISRITRKRLSEDTDFAALCGLTPRYLDFQDSSARAEPAFDARQAYKLADKIEADLILTLIKPKTDLESEPKNWLFCPSAVGSHVDHAAVLLTILKNLALLRMHYHIAFYEDLHYASNPAHRKKGLTVLRQLLRGHQLEPLCVELDSEAQQSKMQAIRLYDSQLTPGISSIRSYTPANPSFTGPHEALWLFQDERLQEPG